MTTREAIREKLREILTQHDNGGEFYFSMEAALDDLVEHDRAVAADAWGKALETIVTHLDAPQMVWTNHGEVTVYDNEDHLNAGRPRPKILTDWLRALPNPFRSVPKENT